MESEQEASPAPEAASGAEGELPEMAARLLEVGMRLFARKGYAATSVREIVQEAQVTNPMLYYYFDSKEGLYRSILEALLGSLSEAIDEALVEVEGQGLRAQLMAVAGAHLRRAEENPLALEFIFSVLFGPREGRPPIDPLKYHVPLMIRLAGIFEQACERGEFVPREGFSMLFLTEQLFGLIHNHMIRILKRQELLEREMECREMMEQLLAEMSLEHSIAFFLGGAGELREEKI